MLSIVTIFFECKRKRRQRLRPGNHCARLFPWPFLMVDAVRVISNMNHVLFCLWTLTMQSERRAGQVNSRLAQWLTDFVFELAERSEPRVASRESRFPAIFIYLLCMRTTWFYSSGNTPDPPEISFSFWFIL